MKARKMATDTPGNRPHRTLSPIRAGVAAECPFCIVRLSPEPEPGVRVRMLSGFRTGNDGTIVPFPPDYPDHPNGTVIMLHYDGDLPTTTYTVFYKRDLVCPYPLPQPPTWMPPLSLRDAGELENEIFDFVCRCFWGGTWEMAWPRFYSLIANIWRKRLPVSGAEVWRLASLHGLPSAWKSDIETIFEHGREILIMAEGRRPIKKKRLRSFILG